MNAAIAEANFIKSTGTRIVTLGIGSSVNSANLIAISSVDAYYSAADFSQLQVALQQIASDLCGGTITVRKIIDADGNLQTTNDQTPGGGWTFNVAGSEKTTDQNGYTPAVEVNAGTYSVSETLPQVGYSFITASCTGAANNGTLDGTTISGIQFNNQNIVKTS